MARRAVTFDTVRMIGLSMPGVEESTAYGAPALKRGGQLVACIATNKAAEPDTLVVRLGFEQRDELIAADPDTYYLRDHYLDFPAVLVRLARVTPDALRDLLHAASRFAGEKPAIKRPRKTKRRG